MKYNAGDTIEVVLDEDMAQCLNDPGNGFITVSLNEIIKHTPKPFDWSEVRRSMAFVCTHPDPRWNDTFWLYVADSLNVSTDRVYRAYGGNTYDCFNDCFMKRAPEHDKDV